MEDQTITEPITTHQTKRNVIIGITVAVLLLVFAGGTYALVKHNPSKSPVQSKISTPTPTASTIITATAMATSTPTSIIIPTAVPGGQLFVSNSLGIYFNYSSSASEQFVTKQVNDRVYVYDSTTTSQPDDGNQFVEVFTKDPNQTLAQAITNTLLKGYNVNDCPIGDGKWDTTNLPSSYQITTMQYKSNNIGPIGGNPNDPSKCPQVYTSGAGEAYFLMDSNIPNKFIFLKIGQSQGANESTNTTQYPYTWNETVRIF